MVNKRQPKKDATPSLSGRPVEKKSLLKREWPLLLFPALVLLALSVLYTAHRTLQEEMSGSGNRHTTAHNITPSQDGPINPDGGDIEPGTDGVGTSTLGALPSDPTAAAPDVPRQSYARPLPPGPGNSNTRPPSFSGSMAGGSGAADPQTVTQLVGTLRQALQQQDHGRIKQVMNDLVAMGDEAVLELGEIVASGTDETALWAAEALARIGTPAAAAALFDTLEQVRDGNYKEQLAKRASNISNHDSWPVLLDAVQESKDPAVQRAAATSLGRVADTPVIDEIIARYDAALTPEEADVLAQVVSNISSPEASAALRTLAGSVSATSLDSLQKAAIDAMAEIGDTPSVNYLLQKLEATPPGQGGELYNTITSIDQPQAEAALRYAAAGSKEVSAEQGRTAAINALANFPSEETYRLLAQIVETEDNAAVVSAALRTLESIEKKQPAIAEKATSKADPTDLLPVDPLKK